MYKDPTKPTCFMPEVPDCLCRESGEKFIPTPYIYELPACTLDNEELFFFTHTVGYAGINDNHLVSGATLFSRITADPDYYIDRAEGALLAHHMTVFGPGSVVTELGPGDGHKTADLFARQPHRDTILYQAIDVSHDFLAATASKLRKVCVAAPPPVTCHGDFLTAAHGFALADVVLLLGTTISNFEPEQAQTLLQTITQTYLKPGGILVIGQDGNHDPVLLQGCYDDGRHHTAAFVMNGLRQIRRDYAPAMDLEGFRYKAFFDRAGQVMRMGIESLQDQNVEINGKTASFIRGEFIQAGQSRKYPGAEIICMAGKAGFASVAMAASPENVNLHVLKNRGGGYRYAGL